MSGLMSQTMRSFHPCLTRRPFRVVVPVLVFCCFSVGVPPVHAQPAGGEQRFEKLDARYWKILVARPRKGTALERWYRLWSGAGRSDELLERVHTETAADAENAPVQLLLGLLLEQRGDFEAAHAALKAAASLPDSDYYAHYALGSLAARRGMLDDASAALLHAAELSPPRAEWLEIHEELGRVQLRAGQRFEALDTWAKVAEQFPDDVPILQEMAELLTAERQYDEAIARWEQVAAHSKDDRNRAVEAERKIAQLEVRAGRRSAAVERLDKLLNRLEPEGWLAAEVRRQIEAVFSESGEQEELAAFYRKRLETRNELGTMLALAAVLSDLGVREESLALLKDAVERAPDREDVQQQLIAQLSRLGNHEEALQVARAFIKRSPNYVEGIKRLADLEVEVATVGRNATLLVDAARHYEQLASVRADDAALALSSAVACESAARRAMLFAADAGSEPNPAEGLDVEPLFDTAEALYREAVRRDPERVAFHEQSGAFLHRQGDSNAAVDAWKMIATESRDTAEMCLQLAEVLKRYEFFEEAATAFRRAIAHDPSRKEPRRQLARLLMNEQAFDAALTELDQLDELAETNDETAELLQLRLDVLRSAERVPESIVQLQDQLATTPATAHGHWMLALLFAENREHLAALEQIELALSEQPQNVPLLEAVASIANRAGEHARAIEVYEELALLQPQLATVHLAQVARLHLMNGDADAARRIAETMVGKHPSNPTGYRMLAEVAAFTGVAAERLAAVRRAVEVSPADPMARQQLAELLERRGQNKESLEHYWRAFELVDSVPERMHLISIMVPLAQRLNEYPRLLERLRSMERQRDATSEAPLLVVEARRAAGDLGGALQEVKSVLARNGNQREALSLAVSLAHALSEHQQAVDFQRRVVRLSPDRPALEKLAECHLAAGDMDGASRAWRQIVRDMGNPQALIEMVDVEIRRGELANAKYLLKIGVEEYPEDWRVLLRAAHVALLEGDNESASEHFVAVWALPEKTDDGNEETKRSGSSAQLAGSVELPADLLDQVPEALELQVAYDAVELLKQQRWVADLAKRQKQILSKRRGTKSQEEAYEHLLQHQRATQQRKVAEQFNLPEKLGPAKLMALCGMLETSRPRGDSDYWYRKLRTINNPRNLAHLAMVAFADEQFEHGQDILTELSSQDPKSPVPHVLRLLATQTSGPVTELSDSQRETARSAVEDSFAWVRRHRPAWTVPLRPLYLNALLNLQSNQRAEAELHSAIETAADIRELPALSTLAARVGQLALQQRVFEQAVDLPLVEQDSPEAVEPLRRMLEAKFLYADDEQYVGSMIAVMDRYFRETQPKAATMRTDGVNRGNNAGRHEDARFPPVSVFLDEHRLAVLERVYQHCDAASRVFLLRDFLQQRASDCEGIDQRCYALASIYVQWWTGNLGTALDELKALCDAAPQEASLRIILAKAYYADGNFELALNELDRLQSRTTVADSSVGRLRRELIGAMVEDDD